jgi:hypothetical protein
MSSNSLETQDLESNSSGVISKVTTFITSKKGMYLFAAIVLVGAIYYYTQNTKKESNEQDQEQQYKPPAGYVTVPVEMLQGLQQQPGYGQAQEEQYEEPLDLQTQHTQPQSNQQQPNQQAPSFRHNQQIDDDDEAEEIQEQNLSKLEMESIQAQLNNMQQQRGTSNNA